MRGEPRCACPGPEGTFTEAALRLLPEAAGSAHAPFPTVGPALGAVRTGDCVGVVLLTPHPALTTGNAGEKHLEHLVD
ncbi:hypothetical protein [Streptomyces sp. NPDC014656]|uniref:hypothetical protein n=1 Tax=Streptomyces sp. NPDC014656 TaxID=3364878 RepID=UPI0036FB07C4